MAFNITKRQTAKNAYLYLRLVFQVRVVGHAYSYIVEFFCSKTLQTVLKGCEKQKLKPIRSFRYCFPNPPPRPRQREGEQTV